MTAMNHPTHRPQPHSDDESELDPSHLPVDPDDGMAPGGAVGEPEPDGVVDPSA